MKKLFLLVILTIFSIGSVFFIARAETDTGDLLDQIAEYEKKIADLQGQVSTLANEVASFDNQISLTQLKIQNSIYNINKTEEDIKKLIQDINDLAVRIDKLEESIDRQQSVLNERIRARYKSRETSPFFIVFGSSTINQLVQKTEYLKVMELQDNKLLTQMRKTKAAYDLQKGLYEQKKNEEETLKQQLVNEKANLDAYKNQLEDQKAQKAKLLEITQNNEVKYQELLADAQRELNQITGAVSALIGQDGESVDKGDLIGYQGNSGYSFGEHLHFGVYRYSSFEEINGWNWYYSNYVNPDDVLKEKNVYWNDGCGGAKYKNVGDGNWGWPLSSPTISQGFGTTCWSYLYGGKPHPAWDMYGPTGSPIYAVKSGEAYYCRNCLGDGGNGVFIFHDDNYMTVYWHLR